MRRDLGRPDLVCGTAELRLNPAAITSDVGEFERALERGEAEQGAALYAGPFLDGVHLKDAPEFERWVDAERARLARAAHAALRTLAAGATERGDHEVAVGWWRRLAALGPTNSPVALGLMQALVATEDRAGALQHARLHEALLREELGVAPDAGITALVERLRTPAGPVEAVSSAPRRDSLLEAVTPLPAGSTAGTSAADAPRPPGSLVEADASASPPSDAPPPRTLRGRPPRRWERVAALGAAVGVVSVGGWAVVGRRDVPAPPTGAGEVIAVAPFRVTAADSSYAYLREGMVDLLSAALVDGTRMRQAVDPGAMLAAWHRAAGSSASSLPPQRAIDVAREVGAGRVVTGAVVGSRHRLVLRASLAETHTGRTRAAAEVAGSPDSLPALVEQLAIRLLAREAGERDGSVAALAGVPLAAVHSYLDGRAAFRRGDYARALHLQQRALVHDSTFALAAMELCRVAGWVGDGPARHRGYVLAWGQRARLSAADRLYLRAVAGPRYPAQSTRTEWLAAWERVAEAFPEQPDGWFEVGDLIYHSPWLDRGGEQTGAFFLRALERGPTFTPALQHLVQWAAHSGDTATVRRFGERAVAAEPTGETAEYLRWHVALALKDSAVLARARTTLDRMGMTPLMWIAITAQVDGVALDDGARALRIRLGRSVTAAERVETLLGMHALALNRGHPSQAASATAALGGVPAGRSRQLQLQILDALYSEGDSTAAAAAGRTLGAMVSVADTFGGQAERTSRVRSRCVLGQWQVARGDLTGARENAAALRATAARSLAAAARGEEPAPAEARLCALLLESAVAVRAGDADAVVRLAALDAHLAEGPSISSLIWDTTNLAAARYFEALGQPERALTVVRRRDYFYRWPHYLAVQLRTEGRLAAAAGDRAGAEGAYRRYLTLRGAPEASVAAEVARVRAELALLSASSTGRRATARGSAARDTSARSAPPTRAASR